MRKNKHLLEECYVHVDFSTKLHTNKQADQPALVLMSNPCAFAVVPAVMTVELKEKRTK